MTTNEMLTKVFNEHHEEIYNQALRVVKNVHDAEDIRSDVYKKIGNLKCTLYNKDNEKNAQFSSWIYRITNHVILDFLRTNHKDRYKAVSDFFDREDDAKSYFAFHAPKNSEADRKIIDAELHSRVAKAFRTLKPKYRKIAILFFLRGYEYTEIADMLNVPMGTVKGMLSRARAKLQTELDGVMSFCSVNVQSVEA